MGLKFQIGPKLYLKITSCFEETCLSNTFMCYLLAKEANFKSNFTLSDDKSALPKHIKRFRFHDVSNEDVQATLHSTKNANTKDGK